MTIPAGPKIDCHIHVLDPVRFPYADDTPYRPSGQEIAPAAHLIRVGNSVTYGGEQRAGSVEEAVGRLGFQLTFRLVGEAAGIQLAQRPLQHYGIDADQLREHMLHTAFACEQLALECGFDADALFVVDRWASL